LPASTIHRILLRRGLVRSWDRHETALHGSSGPSPISFWQMDFKGSKGWDRPVGPLSLLDDHSRYLIALRGTWTTKAEAVREQLESAFMECGVPESHAHGSRHSVVECESPHGRDLADGVA